MNWEIVLAIAILCLTAVTTFFLTKSWIRLAHVFGLVGKDKNKFAQPEVAEAGGLAVIVSIVFGMLLLVFIKMWFTSSANVIEIFAIALTLIFAGMIGFVDDVLGGKKGLSQLQKGLLTIPIALPLMIINIHHTWMSLPGLGMVQLGIIYPLVVVPVAVIGASNASNLLAGYNGLSASYGIIIFTVLGFVAALYYPWLALVSFIAVAALFAFLCFNSFPTKVFEGNCLTYGIGALAAAIAILGNLEKLALMLFIPYFLDAILYVRARVIDKAGDVQAFAKVNPDNSLEMPYSKIYDSTHLAIAILKKIKRKVYEPDVVNLLIGVEAIIAIIALVIGSL
jgi:UDP-N-acetylglucosamine--dolichyl-phosphate N-acetylglucosaminephosphotransferase